MWPELFSALVLGLIVIKVFFQFVKKLSTAEKNKLVKLFSISYFLILVFGTISYLMEINKKNEKLEFWDFINMGKMDKNFYKRVLVGIGSGVVFGIIDNAGLWFGMANLDPLMPKGPLIKAGFGNVFSDTLSAFLATFAGNIISSLTDIDTDVPLWANAGGTFLGCLIGLYGCKLITGRS